MGKQYPGLNPQLIDFIKEQNIFFTASAADDSRVNVSPRSTNQFRVIGDNAVLYLDMTGSGNETAAHINAGGRMTIMFAAFEGRPKILRLYGKGSVIRHGSAEFASLAEQWFANQLPHGARQIMRLDFDLVQSSCGFGVPLFDFQGERENLQRWADAKTDDEIKEYWRNRNIESLDGLPTGIIDEAR